MLSRLSQFAVLIVQTLLIFVLVSGCAPASQETGALPTLVEFPTEPPTEEAPPTATPTDAPPTETPTHTPTSTFTPSATVIEPTATMTFTPSNTAPAQPTATFTLTATVTEAPPTATSEISPTSDTPQIITFTASSSVAAAGGTVELRWETIGDETRIDRLNQLGQVLETFSVTPTGQLPVTIPANQGASISYRITAKRNQQEVTSTLTITVSGTGGGGTPCTIPWFFGNEYAPANAGCPTVAATQVNGAHQAFQTGRMISIEATIYTLINTGSPTSGELTQNFNTWDGSSEYANYSSCSSTPIPAGLFAPQQMFANVYCNTLGPLGIWQNSLGFATAPIETGLRMIQVDPSGALYVDSPDGSVYRLQPVPVGQQTTIWTKIK